MLIRAKPSRRRIGRIVINLASMIDVSFLLLFYFMVASMLGEEEKRLSAGLQTRGSDQAASDFQPQIVEVALVDSRPAYRVGARVMHTRSELLSAIEGLPRDQGLFISVFNDVPVGFAAGALQAAHDAGFAKVTYVPSQ